jgi:hypothetical protein
LNIGELAAIKNSGEVRWRMRIVLFVAGFGAIAINAIDPLPFLLHLLLLAGGVSVLACAAFAQRG